MGMETEKGGNMSGLAVKLLRLAGSLCMGTALFVLGFLAATALRVYTDFDLANLLKGEAPPPSPVQFAEKPAPPKTDPHAFFEQLSVNELEVFDRLYDKRQEELQAVIAAGVLAGESPIPPGLFAQLEIIDSKLDSLAKLGGFSEGQASIRQALGRAYVLLKETYQFEVEFLKRYPSEWHSIGFITGNIFEISSRDQRSGFQYLSCLVGYRKLLIEAIREDISLERNQARLKALTTLNTLIEKYRTRLNVPAEIT